MNEQIQQMIYNLNEKVGVHWTNEDKLKFAELIVRECCDMVNSHVQHNNPNDCLVVLKIKERFDAAK